MKRTLITIELNGKTQEFYFNIPYKQFFRNWTNQIEGVGFVSLFDESGRFVTITPSQCGYVIIESID